MNETETEKEVFTPPPVTEPPTDPVGEPQPPPPEKERHMGYREAVDIFMRLAKSRQRTAEEVTALEMAARQMCRRHFQRQRNWARRREAANEEGGAA